MPGTMCESAHVLGEGASDPSRFGEGSEDLPPDWSSAVHGEGPSSSSGVERRAWGGRGRPSCMGQMAFLLAMGFGGLRTPIP